MTSTQESTGPATTGPMTPVEEARLEGRVQRVLIWLGPLMLLLWLASFTFAGYLPPHDPSDTARDVQDRYFDHPDLTKFMLVVTMAASALLVPWCIAISGQIKRIPGAKALATTQMVSCSLLSLEFIYPVGMWMAVSFRADDRGGPGVAEEITRSLNDMGWILFVLVIWSVWVQMVAICAAVLMQRRGFEVLPRWVGYLSGWVSIIIIPAGTVLFFKDGPWAWNGVIGFWIPLSALVTWILAMTWTVHVALTRQIQEGTAPESH